MKDCKHCGTTKFLHEFFQGGAYCKECTRNRKLHILENKKLKRKRERKYK